MKTLLKTATKTVTKVTTMKLRVGFILLLVLFTLICNSLLSCSMGRYRTTWGKAKHPHLKHTYTNNTDKSW